MIGESVWKDEKNGSDWHLLIRNPQSYRESYKEVLMSTITNNTSFLDWVFDRLVPRVKEAIVVMDMNEDTNDRMTAGCFYKRRVVVPLPQPTHFVKVNDDGPKGALFEPVLETPVQEAIINVLSGDYVKMLDVIEKKQGSVSVRACLIDPPWKHHPGDRVEDLYEEPPSRVFTLKRKLFL